MEKNEKAALLEKAKKEYGKIGTKFISPISKYAGQITNDSVKFIYYDFEDSILLLNGYIGMGNIVYEKGIWAEIISKPNQDTNPTLGHKTSIMDLNQAAKTQSELFKNLVEKPNQGELIGYVVPFDMYNGKVKKGAIIDKDNYSASGYYIPNKEDNTLYWFPPEIVETWEKAYSTPKVETSPDKFQQVIELIEKQISGYNDASEDNAYDLLHRAYFESAKQDLVLLINEIKQL